MFWWFLGGFVTAIVVYGVVIFVLVQRQKRKIKKQQLEIAKKLQNVVDENSVKKDDTIVFDEKSNKGDN